MKRTIVLRVTAPVEIEVDDGFPVEVGSLEKTAKWIINDYDDGRYPFSTEMIHVAAERLAGSAISNAVDSHYHNRIERAFGNANAHCEARNRLAARACQRARVWTCRELEVSATEQPEPIGGRYTYDPHVVLSCDLEQGSQYKLATRTVFAGREAAEAYAATIAPSRQPIVLALPITELRVGEARGELGYWRPPQQSG